MWNERFCQKISLLSAGIETCVQFGWPAGQTTPGTVNAGSKFRLCLCVSNPAGWKFESVTGLVHPALVVGLQPGGGTLLFGAPSVSNSTPADAVVSLEVTVLFERLTFTASWIDTPPPAQPATLFAMPLLVTLIAYQSLRLLGLFPISFPLPASS